MHLHLTESSAFNDSNLLSGWLSYVRADCRDSLSNESHVLSELEPDVLISDIGLPGEDGYTFIRKFRALKSKKCGRVPAIALTAYADTEARIRALEVGFDTHVSKPVDPDELVEIVASLVASCNW